jgi:anti-sigma factor RsiW
MAMSCNQIGRLSTASAGGHATEAERLEVEAHLATCARCSAEHALVLATTRALRAAEPAPLSAAARERVRRAALAQRAQAPAAVRRLRWPLAGGVVLAMAAAVAIWIGVRRPSDFSIVGGDVAVTAVPEASADGARGAVGFHSERGGQIRLADAATAMAPATEIVWRNERRVVELRAGSLTVDVAHRAGQHFEVRTPLFVVEVVGTKFTVDMKGVKTERGTVRVRNPNGGLIGYVDGGQSWALPLSPLEQVHAADVHDEPAPAIEPPAVAAPPAAPDDGAGVRLARARRALVRGNAAEARRLAQPLFRLERDVAAEARAIYAESFLIEGRHADAISAYQIVSRDFPSTPQAESALFAVAQLESEHDRPAEARATLQSYLRRYPNGRFAKEAADRLARLSPPQPR